MMSEETRYWERIGMRVTKAMALNFAEKMNLEATFLDEEVEEFTATSNSEDLAVIEVESLFSNPDTYTTDGDPEDLTIVVIQKAQEWHKERKPRLMELRGLISDEMMEVRSEEIEIMIQEEDISPEKASAKWDERLKARTLEEAKIRWDEEYNEKVVTLQEELGLSTPEQD